MQAFWMLLGALLFATMGVCVKLAAAEFTTAELVFYRGVFSTSVIWLVTRFQGVPLRSAVPGMHAWRSLIGNLSLAAWFFSIGALPLATAMTLNYTSSMWMAVWLAGLAWLGRKEKPPPIALVVSVAISFGGVVLVLRPTFAQNQWIAALFGLASGITAAMAYLQVAALGRAGEPESRTVFYFALGSAALGLVGMLFTGVTPWTAANWYAARWLPPVGVLAAFGQLCMTRAYSLGATMLVANLQYSAIVFSALFSLALFGDQIPSLGWLGMALIIGSNVIGTSLRLRKTQAGAEPSTPEVKA